MNWNGHRQTLDHLIARRIDPANADVLQKKYNENRRSRIMQALYTRPVFIPLQFTMNAAGQATPYRQFTPSGLSYDVLITGIKADVQTRSIIVRQPDDKPLVYVGDQATTYLRTDDIAGQSATTGGGQIGTFYLPQPLTLKRGRRLSIEMFKEDTTAGVEIANVVLIGIRVFPRTYAEVVIDQAEQDRINALVQLRDTPEWKFLKQSVSFSSAIAGGVKDNLLFAAPDEPLLVRGVRTTLRQSSILNINVEGEPGWNATASVALPCWAVMGEDDLISENYQWFSKPIYLRANSQIEIPRITNGGINGVNIDAQTGNTITFICETV